MLKVQNTFIYTRHTYSTFRSDFCCSKFGVTFLGFRFPRYSICSGFNVSNQIQACLSRICKPNLFVRSSQCISINKETSFPIFKISILKQRRKICTQNCSHISILFASGSCNFHFFIFSRA